MAVVVAVVVLLVEFEGFDWHLVLDLVQWDVCGWWWGDW